MLQSPYSTLEYLLWRKYNLLTNSGLQATEPIANIRVSYSDTSSRNLIALVKNKDKHLLLLKQYGSLDREGSFIETENNVVTYLKSSNLVNNISTVAFYDADNKIVAFEYLNDYLSLNIFDEKNATIYNLYLKQDWNGIEKLVAEIGVILCELHHIDVKSAKENAKVQSYEGKRVLHLHKDEIVKYDVDDLTYLFKNWDSERALIHFDVRLSNFLHKNDEKLILIDWEMAIIGDPVWDLAIIIHSICTFFTADFFTRDTIDYLTDVKKVVNSLLVAYKAGNCIFDLDKLKIYLNLQIQKYGILKSETNQAIINGIF